MNLPRVYSPGAKYVLKETVVTAPWITYRPELKVLDCTLRDGGLVNDHMFDDGFVKAIYNACVAAGIDYMEIGYKADGKVLRATSSALGSFVWKMTSAALWAITPRR